MKSPALNRLRARKFLERGVRTELGMLTQNSYDAVWRDYRQAAILGDTQAQFFLAIHYAAGLDGHKNERLATAWFRRAALRKEKLCELVSRKPDEAPEELVRMFAELCEAEKVSAW